jgi:ubiquinone biosynthesis protein UbiJ
MKILLPKSLAEPGTIPWERIVSAVALSNNIADVEELRRAIDQLAARIAELDRRNEYR